MKVPEVGIVMIPCVYSTLLVHFVFSGTLYTVYILHILNTTFNKNECTIKIYSDNMCISGWC